MNNFLKSAIFKLWLTAIIYIVALPLSLGFVFPGSDFPVWFELVLKGTVALAFMTMVLAPILYAVMRLKSKKLPKSKALVAAAWITVAGYLLLFGQLLYVKLTKLAQISSSV